MKSENGILIFLLTFLVQVSAVAQTIYPVDVVLDTTLLELPSIRDSEVLVIHKGYISSFNEDLKIPDWVAYELTAEEVLGGNERSGSFKQDRDIPLRQASNADYLKTGYDKGHMAPAADMKWSEEAMRESFYFTNMCPQKPGLNRRYWLELEDMTRGAARKYGKVWVISGSVPYRDSLVTIGRNNVCVPAKFYKAILANDGNEYFSIAFLLDNVDEPQPACERSLPVDSLEVIISKDLFRNLVDEAQGAESSFTPSRWGLQSGSAD